MTLEEFREQYANQNGKTSLGSPKKKRVYEEDDHQKSFVQWFQIQYPKEKLIGIPNEGRRSFPAAQRMRKMGMLKGSPDLFLPIPSGKFNGLFMEVKSKKGKVKPHQAEILRYLASKRYFVCVVFSFEEAKDATQRYMRGESY